MLQPISLIRILALLLLFTSTTWVVLWPLVQKWCVPIIFRFTVASLPEM